MSNPRYIAKKYKVKQAQNIFVTINVEVKLFSISFESYALFVKNYFY